ncbi:methyltransferase [Rhodopirellula maiorica SM1]|uniref:Methyltransferase n=1 Tax=Rhodopirellula maiorica SM1 TaxID=1265738 RepID=M5RFM8_9BACT|nr:FkbM family methyltransferase [Rhodopirellula maiorica]EMI17886.1 methyltransferase [Rhodopirellula maiorica SM1]
MKNIIHALFGFVGLDVRLKSRLLATRNEEKRLAQLTPWKQLLRYNPATILDIGANDGYSVKVFREWMPEATIYSFEPIADCFRQVEQVLNETPPGQAFHFALGDTNETSIIHRNQSTPSSSLLPMDDLHRDEFPHTTNFVDETIQVKRLDDVADQLQIVGPLIVKIDVQGFEDRVIRGGERTLKMAHAIIVELSSYSLYQGQPSFADVHSQLDRLGFVFRGTVDQMLSPHDGRVLQFDGLFENLRFQMESQSKESQLANVVPNK